MDCRDIEKRVRQWEAEGYEVSDFRQRWFPRRHGGGSSGARVVFLLVVAIFAVVIALLTTRAPQPLPHLYVEEVQIAETPFVIEPQQLPAVQGWTGEWEHVLGIDPGRLQLSPERSVFYAGLEPMTRVWANEPELGLTVEIGEVQLQPGNWVIKSAPGPVTKLWANEPELGLTVEIGEVQLQPGTWMIYTEMGWNPDQGK